MRKLLIKLSIVLFVFIGSCTGSRKSVKEFDPKAVTFSSHIVPIIKAKCSGNFCHHGNPSDLLNYPYLVSTVKKGDFGFLVIESKKMPKGTELTPHEMKIVKAWLANGHPK